MMEVDVDDSFDNDVGYCQLDWVSLWMMKAVFVEPIDDDDVGTLKYD